MKIITGGSGFLGVEIAKKLVERGEKVKVFDITKSPDLPPDVDFVKGDVRDKGSLKQAFREADTVFHLVGIMPQSKMPPPEMRKINIGGTRNVLEACAEEGVKRVVYLSSSEVYGILEEVPCPETALKAPVGEYGHNKVSCELICHEFAKSQGLEVSILRPTSIVGPRNWEETVNMLLGQIKNNGVIPLPGRGKTRWQVAHVSDVANAAILASEKNEAIGEAFNVGCDGEVPTMWELAHEVKEHAGSNVRIISLNEKITLGILKTLGAAKISPVQPDHLLLFEYDFILDVSKIKTTLGWKPEFTTTKAFIDTYDWYVRTN